MSAFTTGCNHGFIPSRVRLDPGFVPLSDLYQHFTAIERAHDFWNCRLQRSPKHSVRRVSNPDPDNGELGVAAGVDEILILCDQSELVLDGKAPDGIIGCSAKARFAHVPGFMADSAKICRQGRRKLFIDEKAQFMRPVSRDGR